MTLPRPKVRRLMRAMFGRLGSPNDAEADTARTMLRKLLDEHGLSWNDLPEILSVADNTNHANNSNRGNTNASAHQAATAEPLNVLELVMDLVAEYITITAEERMAAALWVLHTWIFEQFFITPRLALLSPVSGCGKSTLLRLIGLLVSNPDLSDNTTAAAIYQSLEKNPRTTLLIDEAENLGISRNPTLRSIFTSGHVHRASIDRSVGGRKRKYGIYAPLAVAAIGTLPQPMMNRAVVINMERQPRESHTKWLDEDDPIFIAAREEIQRWATTCSLDRHPDMPRSLRNREADNFRVLFAIADDLGHGKEARTAAVTLCSNRPDEAVGVILLKDIREIFRQLRVDRIASGTLVEELVAIDDGIWAEWRGPNDDRLPHRLTQNELAALLRPGRIRSRTIWPVHRRARDRSRKGYLQSQFTAAWSAYCPTDGTPTQSRNISYLRCI
jgi:putative DNA primase/helicase